MSAVRIRRGELVTTIVVLVLAVGAVFALWPRGDGPDDVDSPDRSGPIAVGPVDPAQLVEPRRAAALDPCPSQSSTATGSGPLAGVVVECLGAPGAVDLGAALAGRTVLINAWATWCPPCRDELPVLADYAARPDAVEVLGLDVRDDPRAALALLTDLGVGLPSVADPDGVAAAALDLPPALPISYLVRPDGSVAMVDPPVPFRSADEVAAAVDRLR